VVIQRYIAGEIPRHPVAELTGIEMLEGADGKATVSLPATEWLSNSNGQVYGGFIELLADAATSTAIGSTSERPSMALATLDLKVYFLRPVQPDGRALTARAEVVQRGRTIALANCRVTNADVKTVAMATSHSMIVPNRPVSLLQETQLADEALPLS
jgi:uncharacterized protein (TIGR00369 family)